MRELLIIDIYAHTQGEWLDKKLDEKRGCMFVAVKCFVESYLQVDEVGR